MIDDLNDTAQRLLDGWGYGEEHRAETELRAAYEKIKELEIELRVTKRLLDSALKLAFKEQRCDC
jgi:hypothetical protein